ncbi:MAG TPA: CPBP family intramembrane glutamic endopeptidase [Candidatus Limnocylindrales bacterium]|nr:CPBP family intramembrane glutamic endopeptidase [Candidatus Limnocylindrales bacterium]
MTGGESGPPEPGPPAPDPSGNEPAELRAPDDPAGLDPVPEVVGPTRPGLRTFSLDGRRAPGLYLVGWLASLIGAATIFVVLLAQPSDVAGAILLGAGTFVLALGLAAAAGSQAIERQADGRLAYRGPSPFILFGAYVALTLLLELLAFPPLQALHVPAGGALEALVDLVLLNGGAVVLVAALVVGSGSLSWREMGVPVRAGRDGSAGTPLAGLLRDLLEGMLLAVPILFVTLLLGGILIQLLGTTPPGPLPVAQTTGEAVLNLVSGILIAPLGEELFYRGFATTAWVRGMGARAGILRGALLFCVAHVLTLSGTPPAALIAFVTRLPVAIALGWIFVKRGSLASSFGLHAMFNAIPLILVGLAVGT